MSRDKYIKGFLAGMLATAYIIPKIDMKKYRRYKDMVEKNMSKMWRIINKVKVR
ncbi:hypothetical protein TKV_c11590 [Thermoanaerobacter kivui]|uniref:Uncharacterized protein n=1 Tax=Thermoanaerobacter kivui TaxID=2325 RepID=A0A097AR88_THEKI|nr:hypothetical protein [Thermoanaerobacter kivui]AIS52330.1 hypothetical protein TKV_c11590 [Thermoanaerobacter kivui]